jgi:hypothetical protein
MIVVPASAAQLLGAGPTLRATASYQNPTSSPPPTVTITVPASTQINDWLFLVVNNYIPIDSTSQVSNFASSDCQLGLGSFNVGGRWHYKHATSDDIGKNIVVNTRVDSTTNVAINMVLLVFTNPNNTDVARISTTFSAATFHVNDYVHTKTSSTANTTSLFLPNTNGGLQYPPNVVKLAMWSSFGATGDPISHSYSGPGVPITVNNSAFSMSLTAVYEVNSSNLSGNGTGTVTQPLQGAMTAQAVYIM